MKDSSVKTDKSSPALKDCQLAILRRPRVLSGVVLLLGFCLFALGYHLRSVDPAVQAYLTELENAVARQYQELSLLEEEHRQQVDALAARLAELQAGSTRLNALGQRLVQVGQLDPEEFQFQDQVAVGGPEIAAVAGTSLIDLRLGIDQLSYRIDRQRRELAALESLLINRELEREFTPAGWPIAKGWISSRFGPRTDPFTGKPAIHAGVDFAGTRGTDVLSVAGGVVVWSGNRSGYGNTVDIDHGNGYVTRYAHNDTIGVAVGERVTAGQTIAQMGATGRASSPHVHFEVFQDGRRINPAQYIKNLR